MFVVIRLSMQVTRRGEHYHGSLTRVSDEVCLPFTGVLEMVAALERLTSTDHIRQPDPGGERRTEVHDA